MANQELLDYIKQQLQQGINKEQIKNSLLSNGWHSQDVYEIFNSLTPQGHIQTNTVPKPPKPISKFKKIILGIASFWPIFFIIIITIIYPHISSAFIGVAIYAIYILNTVILNFIIVLIYIIIVFRNETFSKNKRTLWALIFSLGFLFIVVAFTTFSFFIWVAYGGYIALPIYWYLYIWKKPKQNQLP